DCRLNHKTILHIDRIAITQYRVYSIKINFDSKLQSIGFCIDLASNVCNRITLPLNCYRFLLQLTFVISASYKVRGQQQSFFSSLEGIAIFTNLTLTTYTNYLKPRPSSWNTVY
ncbi:hypothetical protein L9F63_020068, partial [Diploptera punctata]